MRRAIPTLLSFILLLTAAPAGAGGEPAPVRAVIPITASALPGGGQRFSVPVSLNGGAPIQAMLDTGSVGLRLMPGVATAAGLKGEGPSTRVNFGSGVELSGPLAQAEVGIGSAPAVRIAVQTTDQAACLPGRPKCAAARASAVPYRIGGAGLPDGGFPAILGIGLRPGAAGNPLIPAGGVWIVLLPRPDENGPGDAGPGELILNPTPAEQQGFTLFQLTARQGPAGSGWLDTGLPACLSWGGGQPICGPTLLDSGAPQVTLARAAGATPVRPGLPATLSFGAPGQGPAISFRLEETPAARLRVFAPRPGRPREGLNTGVLPYYRFAVLYDARRGVIGLKPRD